MYEVDDKLEWKEKGDKEKEEDKITIFLSSDLLFHMKW